MIHLINSLRPRRNRRFNADDIFKCIFLDEDVWIPIKSSLKFVPKGPINNISPMVQIMAWRRPGDKPLSEPMVVSLPTHICVTRPQWVNITWLWLACHRKCVCVCESDNHGFGRWLVAVFSALRSERLITNYKKNSSEEFKTKKKFLHKCCLQYKSVIFSC